MEPGRYSSAQYFSESQKQFVHVDAMVLTYARNVFVKLMRDDQKNFERSTLCKALVDRLCPSDGVLKTLLATKGEVTYWVGASTKPEVKSLRQKFYRMGNSLGVKVETDLDEKGDWLVARCEPVGVEVKVNRV